MPNRFLFIALPLCIGSLLHGQTDPCPPDQRGLRLEPAGGNLAQHDAGRPVAFSVKVRVLKECKPAVGIPVSFALPATGLTAGAVFPGGFASTSVQSDGEGYAVSPPMMPNVFSGSWNIRVSAGSGTEAASLAIDQHSFSTTASVASRSVKPKSNAWKYALGILIPGAAVGAVCASGHCGGGGKSVDPCTQNPASCALTVGTPQFGPHK